jgi:hypothetical protein
MIKLNNKEISKATKKINLTQQLIIYRSMQVKKNQQLRIQ